MKNTTIEFVPISYFDAARYFTDGKRFMECNIERIHKEYVVQQLFITDAPNGRLDLLYQKTPDTLGYLTTK